MPRSIMKQIDSNTYKDKWSERIYSFYSKDELMESLSGLEIIDYEIITEERMERMVNRIQKLHSVIAGKAK